MGGGGGGDMLYEFYTEFAKNLWLGCGLNVYSRISKTSQRLNILRVNLTPHRRDKRTCGDNLAGEN